MNTRLSKTTSYITLATLGGTLLYKLGQSYDNDRLQTIRNLEASVLGIATVQYGVTLTMTDQKRIQRWRYLDWILTTPLLLRTFVPPCRRKRIS